MDTMRRNMIFEANKKKIDRIIRRNAPLLIALRLEPEDVYQELAIAALQAIESFDPMRSESLEAHIWMQLQYAILTIKRRYKHHDITAMERPYPVMLSVELAEDLGCPFPAQQRDDVQPALNAACNALWTVWNRRNGRWLSCIWTATGRAGRHSVPA